jgi:CheY-like chemotaxis protein
MTSVAPARRILVVDDDPDIAQSFATLLQLLGHEAWAITDARTVLGTVARRRPDAVFLDIRMPHVDGFQITRMLKQAFPAICVVAITGQDSDEYRKQGRQAGLDAYVTKPADIAMLESILATVFPPDRP